MTSTSWLLLPALLVFGLTSCKGADEEDKATPLTSLAEQVKSSGVVDRLTAIEGRLGKIEERLEVLSTQIEAGVISAPKAIEGPAPIEEAVNSPEEVAVPPKEVAVPPEEAAPAQFKLTVEEPAQAVKLVLWHAYRGKEKDALEEAVSLWGKKFPKVEIDAQEVPFSALRDKLVVTIPRGTGPDLFIYAHNNIGDWLLKGDILVPLNSYVEEYDDFDELDRFMPDTIKALAYGGTMYGLPMAFKSHALFYHKDLVKTPPATFYELIASATAAQASGGEGEDKVYGLVYDAGLLYNHAPWANGFGAEILDQEGRPHIDSAAMLASVKLVNSLFTEHKILPDLNDAMATYLFNSGKAAFVIKGPWFLGELDEGVDYGVALLPEVAPGKPARPFLGSEGIYLSHCSKNKELAFQVMRFLTGRESARIRYVTGQQLVPNVAVYEDSELGARANPALEVFKRQAANTVVMSSAPEMQAVWSVADNALRKSIFGGADAKEAFAEAQTKVSHDIKNMGK